MKVTKDLYTTIQRRTGEIAKKIEELEKFEQDFNVSFIKLNNIGFTIHNKLVELEKIFKQANVPFFSTDGKEMCLVSEAIVYEFIYYMTQSLFTIGRIIDEININFGDGVQNPIKHAFRYARSAKRYLHDQPVFTQKQIDSINEKIREVNQMGESARTFNLEDNLLDTLKWYIDISYYDPEADMMYFIIRECTIPLAKLGQESTLINLHKVYEERQQLDPIDQENIGVIYNQMEQTRILKEYILATAEFIEKMKDTAYKKKFRESLNRIMACKYSVQEYPIMITELERLFSTVTHYRFLEEGFMKANDEYGSDSSTLSLTPKNQIK